MPPPQPPQYQQWNPQQVSAGQGIQEYYKRKTGQVLSLDDAINIHLSGGRYVNPQNIQAAYRGIDNSKEAKAYGSSLASTTGPTPGTTTPFLPPQTGPVQSGGTPGQSRQTFGYGATGETSFTGTPMTYAGGYNNLQGFDPAKIGTDPSIKYMFAASTAGLNPNDPSFLPTVVARLKEQGLTNAKVVGEDKIDFGLGDQPYDVLNGELGSNAGIWWGAPDSSVGYWYGDNPEAMGATNPATNGLMATVPGTTPVDPNAPPAAPTMPAHNTTRPDEASMDPALIPPPQIIDATKQRLVSQGIRVAEVVGNKMRIITEEDLARGDVYGSWIDVSLGGETPSVPSLASVVA